MNENVLVEYNRNDNTVAATYTFDDIPNEEVKLYGNVVIALHRWGFNIEIEDKLYSSESSKTLCTYIQLLTDAAIVCELRRDDSGKFFLYLARVEGTELSDFTVLEEDSEGYTDFFRNPVGEDMKLLLVKHLANPEFIPVGRCA